MTKPKFDHIGGHHLIDFVNTEIVRGGQRIDLLAGNADVMAWLLDVGLITKAVLQYNWRDDPTLLAKIHIFRQQMREMLDTIAAQQSVGAKTVEAINEQLLNWQGQPKLIRRDDGFETIFSFVFTETEQVLAHIAAEAADFLTAEDLSYVKRCDNDECIRFFLDTSKNHSRRWCSMEGCGNRMKARAHYARKQ